MTNIGKTLREFSAAGPCLPQGVVIRESKATFWIAENVSRETNAGVTVIENVEENRIQLIFPGKPSPEIRKTLKQSGFRWAPSSGAWQRFLNNAGRYAAERVVEALSV